MALVSFVNFDTNLCPSSFTFEMARLQNLFSFYRYATDLPSYNFVEINFHFFIEKYKLDPA